MKLGHVAALFLLPGYVICQDLTALRDDPGVSAAFQFIRQNEPHVLDEQVRLCEIPATPFGEQARARELERLFSKLGLQDVRIDLAGNAIGVRPGVSAHPNVVLSAHLDTVFPEGTSVKVERRDSIFKGPGIGDDCRGLAVLLGVIEALNEAKLHTRGTITFVADTGEEGLGDLRGVRHLFNTSLRGQIDDFVSIDGPGLGVTNVGVGSIRYRVTYRGEGGHSFGSFGLANPIHALGRAIAKIADLETPAQSHTSYNVGRIGGGTSVNAIPMEAWMEVDLRSTSETDLEALSRNFRRIVEEALEEERRHATRAGELNVLIESAGVRPVGKTPANAPIVRTALSALAALGLPLISREGSTDANLPMSLHIPAITIGGGGTGSGAHTIAETFDSRESWRGTEYALLLVLALTR